MAATQKTRITTPQVCTLPSSLTLLQTVHRLAEIRAWVAEMRAQGYVVSWRPSTHGTVWEAWREDAEVTEGGI